ncbi:MAG TPA: phospholipase D-like domain-containing protein [Xanthomonadales bacterium]|nr:phospholipase D-like domain-containing protein [Xanthomonadales bacterium]
MLVLATVIATVVVVVLAYNFAAPERRIEHRLERLYSIDDPQFRRSLSALLGPQLIGGNHVEMLINGDRIFPAMLEAIRGAQHTINFESYIYLSGDVGTQFADALAERARAGVEVHLLVDWAGSQKMDDALITKMKDAGVEIERYHPPRWYHLGRMNNRTHRKLLIVDGTIGFTGGVGIADQWSGDAQDPDHWRDTHYRVTGPVVAQLQAAFNDNWLKVSQEIMHGPRYFPPLEPVGAMNAQVFTSSPSGGSESMHLMYLMAITAAQEEILISASYFVPDDLTQRALVDARKRGVRVEIVLPGHHMDAPFVEHASRKRWGPLLAEGVRIYEYQPTMYHAKAMVADGFFVSVGSTNFDPRSFRLNDEANLNLLDRELAALHEQQFELDKAKSKEVTYEEWAERPWHERAREKLAGLVESQL